MERAGVSHYVASGDMSRSFGAAARWLVTVLSLLCAALVAVPPIWAAEPQADSPQADVDTETSPPAADYSLESVIEEFKRANQRTRKALSVREARHRERLSQAKAKLEEVRQRLAATEAEGQRLERRFDSNETELDEKTELLKNKIGALKELFGVFQQTASDLIGAFVASPTSLQYPDRDVWLEGFANRMKNASEVTSTSDIKALWYELLREIHARGEIVQLKAPVYAEGDGSTSREVVRVGGFNLITAEPVHQYLQWRAGEQRVETMPRQPRGAYLAQIGDYLEADEGVTELSVDPTGGVLLGLLTQKPTPRERIDQGGLVGYMIIGLGVIAFVLALVKLVDISVVSVRVADQRRNLDMPKANNSLGRLLQTYRDNAQADSETLQLQLHDRVSKEADRIHRFTVFLAIIASVAPLMGLLGTVVGMINTFQAITLYGTGDPQTMAGGISQALITTVLGLVVAVPSVLLNAAVNARANRVVTILRQQIALLMGDRLAEEGRDDAEARLNIHPAMPRPS